MDKWSIYNILKNDTDKSIPEIETLISSMNRKELEEGILEYVLMKRHEKKVKKVRV